jgi:hypothetical protein
MNRGAEGGQYLFPHGLQVRRPHGSDASEWLLALPPARLRARLPTLPIRTSRTHARHGPRLDEVFAAGPDEVDARRHALFIEAKSFE